MPAPKKPLLREYREQHGLTVEERTPLARWISRGASLFRSWSRASRSASDGAMMNTDTPSGYRCRNWRAPCVSMSSSTSSPRARRRSRVSPIMRPGRRHKATMIAQTMMIVATATSRPATATGSEASICQPPNSSVSPPGCWINHSMP